MAPFMKLELTTNIKETKLLKKGHERNVFRLLITFTSTLVAGCSDHDSIYIAFAKILSRLRGGFRLTQGRLCNGITGITTQDGRS